ncbi:MAG: RluA family pseudouridine synthase [Candidatus Marinimicrobia bacterium]|nr:RluA family pseudouridine synthase [Candidatus Neomarinimicrobiota bacterium]
MTSFHFRVGEGENIRLDKFLSAEIQDYSRTQIQQAIREGNALVDGEAQKASFLLSGGEEVEITISLPNTVSDSVEPEPIPLDIVFEDDFLLMLNKPAGLSVHPGAGQPNGTLVNGLVHYTNQLSGINGALRPGIVHRLDKDTSGIIAAAKTNKAHRHLGKQFEERSVEKEYVGIVWGKWEGSGTMDKPIKRSRNDRTKYEVQDSGRLAKTDFNVLSSNTVMSIVQYFPKTGRTHQIRVHSEHAGHPIIGDEKYGGGKNRAKGFMPEVQQKIRQMLSKTNRHLLHAKKLSFTHPESGERVTFEAPVSDDMKRVIEIAESFDE